MAAANGKDHDEFYAYDGLQRLKNAQRGDLTGNPYSGVTSRNREQDFTLDQLGNWPTFKERDTDVGGTWDLDQDRDHNEVNEIDDITTTTGSAWIDPVHDAAGNMTTMPQPKAPSSSYTATYDAWNRLVRLEVGMDLAQANEYDGLHRRIVRDDSQASTTILRHFYYNEQWQVVEERVEFTSEESQPINQYVWHPYYVDALAVRYYDADRDGNLAENNDGRHYYLQDANFNVTAVVNDSATVLERYGYTPYGEATILDADFSVDGDQISDIGNNYLYTGRERDPETGLQLNRYRWYHALLGRWVTRDPIGYEGRGWNLYEYTKNRPLLLIDPSGLQWHHWFPQGNGIPQLIKALCGDLVDIHQYTTWVNGSTNTVGSDHWFVHYGNGNYNNKVLKLIEDAKGDCCGFLDDMVGLIYSTWTDVAIHNGSFNVPDIQTRPYPGVYPGQQPGTTDDLFDEDGLIDRCRKDPCRKPRAPKPPEGSTLPWWVPGHVGNDWMQDTLVVGGIVIVAVGVVVAAPVVAGGGATAGTGAAATGSAPTVVTIGGSGTCTGVSSAELVLTLAL